MTRLMEPPTPYEFEQNMKRIVDENNTNIEVCHMEMDSYICEVMESLRYTDGIRIFRTTLKGYA